MHQANSHADRVVNVVIIHWLNIKVTQKYKNALIVGYGVSVAFLISVGVQTIPVFLPISVASKGIHKRAG